MNGRRFLSMAAVLALVAAGVAQAETTTPNVQRSTEKDRSDVAMTAYNSGVALVRDVRKVNMPSGPIELKFMDVAARVIPETVHVEQKSADRSFDLQEQNYEYDLLSPDALLQKFLGKTVILRETSSETLETAETEATLLSVVNGKVYQAGDKILLNPQGSVVVPEVPENLVARPTLSWLLNSPQQGDYEFETSYLTEGVSWKADYIAVLNDDDTVMDLSAWVTLDNRSGVGYENAELKLVAGDVRRVQPPATRGDYAEARMMSYAAKAAPAFQEEALFEYHLYDLQWRTDIKNNQTKQIALLAAPEVPVTKKYRLAGDPRALGQRPPAAEPQKVGIILEFENKDAPGLGVPLPAGTVRTYKRDSESALQFTGEDAIGHTPRDETVKLTVGSAFDIVAERKQTDFQQIRPQQNEVEVEVEVRNRKDEAVTVTVEESLPGDWTIIEQSHPHEKKDARTAVFGINISANATVTLRYRTRYTQ
jgi:hypothetical protein